MHNQLSDYSNDTFNPFLAAFRKRFGCQYTLLRLLEDWRKALDNHKSAAAVLIALSKALIACPMVSKLKNRGLTGWPWNLLIFLAAT